MIVRKGIIMARLSSPEELENFRQEILSKRDPNKPCISICAGAGCIASGADEVIDAFKDEIEKQGLQAEVDTKGTGCPGFCERGPVVVIYPAGDLLSSGNGRRCSRDYLTDHKGEESH